MGNGPATPTHPRRAYFEETWTCLRCKKDNPVGEMCDHVLETPHSSGFEAPTKLANESAGRKPTQPGNVHRAADNNDFKLCPECTCLNPRDASTCDPCGHLFTKPCPFCSHPNLIGAPFCGDVGKSHNGCNAIVEGPSLTRSRTSNERKHGPVSTVPR